MIRPRPLFLAFVAAAVSTGSPVSAAVIYSDSFSTNGALGGAAPDVRPGTQTWTSNMTVASGGLAVSSAATSFLPFTITAGNIYSLAVDVTSAASITGTSTFAGLGFFNSNAVAGDVITNRSPSTPWAFIRTSNPTTGSIGDTAYRPNGSTGTEVDTNFTVTNTNRLELILNTNDTNAGTAGDQFSLTFLVNGVQRGTTYTYNATESAALLANIAFVGLTHATNSGNVATYDNFVLQTIPEPSSLLIGASGMALLAIRRRK